MATCVDKMQPHCVPLKSADKKMSKKEINTKKTTIGFDGIDECGCGWEGEPDLCPSWDYPT